MFASLSFLMFPLQLVVKTLVQRNGFRKWIQFSVQEIQQNWQGEFLKQAFKIDVYALNAFSESSNARICFHHWYWKCKKNERGNFPTNSNVHRLNSPFKGPSLTLVRNYPDQLQSKHGRFKCKGNANGLSQLMARQYLFSEVKMQPNTSRMGNFLNQMQCRFCFCASRSSFSQTIIIDISIMSAIFGFQF